MNHLKGYVTAGEAARSKAARQPGAWLDESCRCGLVHVRQAAEAAGAGLRPCGKAYATEDEARQSKRGQADGASIVLCPLRGCGKWHVRLPETPRRPLTEGRDSGPDAATRLAVYERDGNCCVCCGTPLDGLPRSVGHRKRRSQGGGHELSNLLTFRGLGINPLDPGDHHARIDTRTDPHDEARGYSLRSWQKPAEVGVMIMSAAGSGVLVWLDDAGGYSAAPPAGSVAA